MQSHTGTIKEIKQINKDVYSVKFFASTVSEINPGQYISILCNNLTLRRPFSVADFSNNEITILIKLRGKGTDYITSLEPDDKIEFSAPLGNGFKIENKRTLLIGAGIGVAPLIYLNKKLKELNVQTYFSSGFLTREDIVEIQDFVSTDDGSNGFKGSICEYLDKIINDFKPQKIVSCAPQPVLKFVSQLAQKYSLDAEICMEKVMACGIGVCRGCVIKTIKNDEVVNKTVCKDGPVFNSAEVVW